MSTKIYAKMKNIEKNIDIIVNIITFNKKTLAIGALLWYIIQAFIPSVGVFVPKTGFNMNIKTGVPLANHCE